MASVREQILANLLTAMGNINGVSPYLTAVKKKDRDFLPPERLHSSDYPAVFVTGGNEPKEFGVYGKMRGKLRAEIRGFVKKRAGTPLSTDVNALFADVERAAMDDTTRGGLALSTKPLDSEVDELSIADDVGGFLLPFEVDYFYTVGSP